MWWPILLAVFLWAQAISADIFVPQLSDKHVTIKGDFSLGVLLPVHGFSAQRDFCAEGVDDLSLLQRLEAISFAVEEINLRDDILSNHTLGFFLYDDCNKGMAALAQTLRFIQDRRQREGVCMPELPDFCTDPNIRTHNVVGLLASESSVTSARVASLLTFTRIPQVSYLATSPIFNNKMRYPYFQRGVPPDTEQAAAIVALMQHFNWTYGSIVYSEGEYGKEGYQALERAAKKRGICFIKAQEIPRDWAPGLYHRLVLELLLKNNATTVVVWVSQFQTRLLLEAADRMRVGGRITWIFSDASARNIADLDGIYESALGAFSVNINSSNVRRFDERYSRLKVTETINPWLNVFLETYYNCTLESNTTVSTFDKCPVELKFSDHPLYSPDKVVSLVYDAVYTFAHGLNDALQSSKCVNQTGEDQIRCVGSNLVHYLPKVRFAGEDRDVHFDRNGNVHRSYTINNVQNRTGKWNLTHIATFRAETRQLQFTGEPVQWSQGKQPTSVCSKTCDKGHAQFMADGWCCWVCEPCADNQYARPVFGTMRCFNCRPGTLPDPATRTTCRPIHPTYLKWHEPLGVLVSSIAASGLVACLLTAAIFMMKNSNALVKASSRELSYLLLASLIVSYSFCYCFVIKPSDVVCFLRLLGLSLCFTLMYAPLVVKTTRIYRIFESGQRMNRRPSCVSFRSQMGISVGIVVLHVSVVVCWALLHKPKAVVMTEGDVSSVVLKCYLPRGPFITSLVYNFLLLVASVFCAFKTRKLPDNFNESKFISFCVYSTVVIWLAFIPSYFAVGSAFYQTMLLSLAVLANATLILTCIFLPKIYAIYFVSKSNQHVSPGFKVTGGARRLTVTHPHCSRAELLAEAGGSLSVNTPNGSAAVDNVKKGNARKGRDDAPGDMSNGTIQLQVSPVDGVCGPYTEITSARDTACMYCSSGNKLF